MKRKNRQQSEMCWKRCWHLCREMEKTASEYSNPAMENYVVEGQLDIFDFISDPEKEKGSEPDEHSN